MKKGEVFIVTSGEFADYSIRRTFRALKDFSWDDEVRKFVVSGPGADHDAFFKALQDAGLVEDAPLKQVHVGDYGTQFLVGGEDD